MTITKLPFKNGGYLPNQTQLLLLKAALSEPELAFKSWNEWIISNKYQDLDTLHPDFLPRFYDQLDAGSIRLLPLVSNNLTGISDPFIQRLKGQKKLTWTKNIRLLDTLTKIILRLNEENIDHIILKGIPLSIFYYKDLSVRPTNDIDILIKPSDRDRVLNILTASPFLYSTSSFERNSVNSIHAIHFYNNDLIDIDIHWYLFYEHVGIKNIDNDIWKNKEQVSMMQVKTNILSPTDFFFLCLAQGREYENIPPIRWIADCCTIYYQKKDSINWNDILSYSKKYHFILYVSDALNLLKKEFNIHIPDEVLHELTLLVKKISLKEKILHRLRTVKNNRKGLLYTLLRLARDIPYNLFYFLTYRKPIEKSNFFVWYIDKKVKIIRYYLYN